MTPKNPFPGLRPFTLEEANLFFGREKQVRAVLKLLNSNGIVFVTGVPGIGKTSLVQCGVAQEFLKTAGESARIISFCPGVDPIRSLVDAFMKNFPGKIGAMEDVVLLNGDVTLESWLKEHDLMHFNFLLIIDKLEEIFRDATLHDTKTGDNRVKRFVDLISGAVHVPEHKIRVAITIRSERIGECSACSELTGLLNRSHYMLPVMTRDNYREVIEGPLKQAGVSIDGNLLTQLLDETGEFVNRLPMLQHAMMRTFDHWKVQNKPSKPLSVINYESTGTLLKAVSQHADEAFSELGEKQKEICQIFFKTITEKNGVAEGISRPATIGKIAGIAQCATEEVIGVVNHFRSEGRIFLTPCHPQKLLPASTVDLSHELLMQYWDKLRLWVEEEASSVAMYRKLVKASALYQAGRIGLLRPPDLDLALRWKEEQKPRLEWAAQYNPAFERSMLYLNLSQEEYLKEQNKAVRLQKRKLRMPLIITGVAGIMAVTATGLFFGTREGSRQVEVASNVGAPSLETPEPVGFEAEVFPEDTLLSTATTLENREPEQREEEPDSRQESTLRENIEQERREVRIARTTSQEARRQQQVAAQNEQAAVEQMEQAETERQREYRNRLISKAKSIAVRSLQLSDDPDLQALLAVQAYRFNSENGGYRYDADIYRGLYNALKSKISDGYNVYSGHNYSVRSLAWYKRRNGFLSADSQGKILFMSGDFRNNRSNSLIANTGHVNEAVAISPDETLFACGTDGGGLYVFQMSDPSENYSFREAHGGKVQMLAFYDSGRRLVSAGADNTIMKWNLNSRTGELFAQLESRPTSMAVSNALTHLVVGTRDGKLVEYLFENPGDGRILYHNSGNPVMAVTYSPNDNQVVIGTLDGSVRIINRSNISSVITVKGPEARVTDLAYSNNGKFLAAASHDGNVYLWETSDWNEQPVVVGDNQGFVLTLCFSDDSRHFYSGSTKAPLLIGRPVESSLMVNGFCALINRNLSREEWNMYIGDDIPYEKTCPEKEP
ncbi:MAG: hypothetical protein JXR52_01710 [Bacteroidales bacterium]|nr:hypothetical protein [Bacteroidales bacterium]